MPSRRRPLATKIAKMTARKPSKIRPSVTEPHLTRRSSRRDPPRLARPGTTRDDPPRRATPGLQYGAYRRERAMTFCLPRGNLEAVFVFECAFAAVEVAVAEAYIVG